MIKTNLTKLPQNTFLSRLLLILVPMYVGRVQEIVPFLTHLYIAKITMILALLAYVSNRNLYADVHNDLNKIPQSKYIVAIFITALIGVPFSEWPAGSRDGFF
jgi:hypothetical protein